MINCISRYFGVASCPEHSVPKLLSFSKSLEKVGNSPIVPAKGNAKSKKRSRLANAIRAAARCFAIKRKPVPVTPPQFSNMGQMTHDHIIPKTAEDIPAVSTRRQEPVQPYHTSRVGGAVGAQVKLYSIQSGEPGNQHDVHLINVEMHSGQAFTPRDENQDIVSYLRAEIHAKDDFLRQALDSGLKSGQRDPSGVTFFTLPEFFWNCPWSVINNEDELRQASQCYLELVAERIGLIMKDYPQDRWGKLVLLPGTVLALIDTEGQVDGKPVYEALNYLLCASNVMTTPEGKPALSMWPKRHTSHIDLTGRVCAWASENVWKASLGQGSQCFDILIKRQSGYIAEHYSADGYAKGIGDVIMPGLPFTVDICLDHYKCQPGEGADRGDERANSSPVLYFLIAQGMSLEPANDPAAATSGHGYPYPDTLRHLVRNDGTGRMGVNGAVEVLAM